MSAARAPRLLVLGSGSILPHPERAPAGYALRLSHGRTTLLDAGPGTIARFGRCGGRIEEIERVCLTHFHPDHCLDVAALLFARRNPALAGALPPLEICGPRGTAALLANLQKVWGGWVREEGLLVTELEPGGPAIERTGFALRALPTHHTEHALCFRFELSNRSTLCYSGDSDAVEELVLAAREVDWLLCECSFADADHVEGHLTPSRVAEVGRAARARRIVLTHFYPSLDPALAARVCAEASALPVHAAFDGAVFALEPASAEERR